MWSVEQLEGSGWSLLELALGEASGPLGLAAVLGPEAGGGVSSPDSLIQA